MGLEKQKIIKITNSLNSHCYSPKVSFRFFLNSFSIKNYRDLHMTSNRVRVVHSTSSRNLQSAEITTESTLLRGAGIPMGKNFIFSMFRTSFSYLFLSFSLVFVRNQELKSTHDKDQRHNLKQNTNSFISV